MKPKLISKSPEDKEKAEIMQKLLDYEWDKYSGAIEALVLLKMQTEYLCGVTLPEKWGEDLMQEIFLLGIEEGNK